MYNKYSGEKTKTAFLKYFDVLSSTVLLTDLQMFLQNSSYTNFLNKNGKTC